MGLTLGNLKLGLRIWHWSVLPITSCPGRSCLCEEECYACKGHYYSPVVTRALERNLEVAESPDFVGWMKTELRRTCAETVRIHVAGDFRFVRTVRAWTKIAKANPDRTFVAYTRSWRVSRLYDALRELAKLPNVLLWFSCDKETGAPPLLPYVKRAYMAVDDDDSPRYKVDLVFRTQPKTPMRFDRRGNWVCPYDQGLQHKVKVTCSACMKCYEDKELPTRWPRQSNPRLCVAAS